MTFSIIIPLYNKHDSIKHTLDSVSKIIYPSYEVIVVDDGSTDNSASVVKQYEGIAIKYFYKQNGGVSSARNYGAHVAEGDWLVFLDADDCLMPDGLSVFNSMMQKYPDADVIVGNYNDQSIIAKNVRTHSKERMPRKPSRELWEGRFYPRPGAFCCKKEAFEKSGGFDERMAYFEDGHFGVQLIANNKMAYTPKVVMNYNQDACFESRKLHPIESELAYYIPEIQLSDIWIKDWYYNVLTRSLNRRIKAYDENGVKYYKSIENDYFGGVFPILHKLLYLYKRLQAKFYR